MFNLLNANPKKWSNTQKNIRLTAEELFEYV